MRLLLDEQLAPAIAEQLRRRGHDVITVADAGLAGLDDVHVLAAGARDRRAVVTNNVKDFRVLHAAHLTMSAAHSGIILVPSGRYSLARQRLGPLVTALDDLLTRLPAEDALQNAEHFL